LVRLSRRARSGLLISGVAASSGPFLLSVLGDNFTGAVWSVLLAGVCVSQLTVGRSTGDQRTPKPSRRRDILFCLGCSIVSFTVGAVFVGVAPRTSELVGPYQASQATAVQAFLVLGGTALLLFGAGAVVVTVSIIIRPQPDTDTPLPTEADRLRSGSSPPPGEDADGTLVSGADEVLGQAMPPPPPPATTELAVMSTEPTETVVETFDQIPRAPMFGPQVVELSSELEAQVRSLMAHKQEVAAVRLVCDTVGVGILDAQKTVRALVGR
jgi:hypothetical protein